MRDDAMSHVAVWKQADAAYPLEPPFHPAEQYPELRLKGSDVSNQVYESVRQLFLLLKYDYVNYGTANWNPLGWLVKPGQTVLIKPNLVRQDTLNNCGDWQHVITHGSIVRAVIDYVYIALEGHGRIQVADAPQGDSDMKLLRERFGIEAIQAAYFDQLRFAIDFIDLRDEGWKDCNGIMGDRRKLPGDPLGTIKFDMGADSCFGEIDNLKRRYYGAFYDEDQTNNHHTGGRHEYVMAKSPLAADIIISIPKLKTHKKVGVTVNLKGVVGITADKNCLPHYSIGSPTENGDQFPERNRVEGTVVRFAKKRLAGGNRAAVFAAKIVKGIMYRIFGDGKRTIRAGNWWGNDTCWRMTLDLNRILLYGNPDGSWRKEPKPYLSVVDGIVAMEGDGPMGGIAKHCAILLGGKNPASVDAAAASVMGFDCAAIPLIVRSFDNHRYGVGYEKWQDVTIVSNVREFNCDAGKLFSPIPFLPHWGWKGAIEVKPERKGLSRPSCGDEEHNAI
ncbi:MAG: DUF362 domain-containing protein [Terracidiphilus sp.]|jgi:uncharacterized protein (DUF362 family)